MSAHKPIIWTAAEAAAATGGKTTGTWGATGLSFDSRQIEPGQLFIALKAADFPTLGGGTSDGHAYVASALQAGAVAAIVETVPAGMEANDPRLLIVKSTRAALDDLGRTARARTSAKMIAITGSVGKTSTRTLLSLCSARFGQVHESAKNYNNEMGVPLTLANLPMGADYGIIEMGMNHANELTPLSRAVAPDIAIITNVSPVHIENFSDGLVGIANAKSEIFSGLSPDHGIAILPRDVPSYAQLLANARTAGVQTILSFGEHAEADARLTACIEARNGTKATAIIRGRSITFFIPAGRHQAMNALAVLLAIDVAGLDVEKAAAALTGFTPGEGRGREEKLNIGDPENPVILIDESYNASPASMEAAFRVVALIDPGRGGRRIAILGDMLELGSMGPKLHADLALPLRAAGINLVYTCGTLMKNLHDSLPANQRGTHRDTSTELAQIVPDVLVPGDVVMVKGSHGSRMDLVVEALRALPARKAAQGDANKGNNRHAL